MDIHSLLKAELTKQNAEKRKWSGKIGDEDITLYSTPISPYDNKVVGQKHPGFESSPTASALVYLICHKATDENDKLVFNKARDAKVMERIPLSFTSEIAQALFGDDFDEGDLDIEALEKNS